MPMYRFLECTAGLYMSRSVRTVTRDLELGELQALFAKHDFNAFPVMEGDRVVGLVTKFDFLKTFVFTTKQMVPQYEELMARTVGEVMAEAVVHVEPKAPLTRVLQLMVDLRARSFPVMDDDGALAGMISREDIMRALKDAVREGD
jgi:CBS-domain-containing membrane protein